ncbi:hypothetical protein SAMN05444352_10563 [Pseudomonas japonica]|uniref:Uncharacterized protein n=3 Tax=Pseudomonas japonica TaxID=256466 RepID=A0A239CVN8_9PSED|nr:hypothetical protein SAMN05444352_10563 [Pseudomonas japonica]
MANKGYNGVLSLSPKDVGQKMAMGIAEYFAKDAWGSLMGRESDKILDRIRQLEQQLQSIRDDISRLSMQVTSFQLDVKISDLDFHATEVTSIYERYQSRLDNYITAVSLQNADLMEGHKKELDKLGEEIDKHVYNHLNQIHRLLITAGADSFGVFQLLNSKYQGRDIFTRFYILQSLLSHYFCVQMQGITLLSLAGREAGVSSYLDDVRKIDANIKDQISRAARCLPDQAMNFITLMLRPANQAEWMPPVPPSMGQVTPPVPVEPEPLVPEPGHAHFVGEQIKTVVSTSLMSIAMLAWKKPVYLHLHQGFESQGYYSNDSERRWNIAPAEDLGRPPSDQPYLFNLIYMERPEMPLVLALTVSKFGTVPVPLAGDASARNHRWAIYANTGGALWFEYHGNSSGGRFEGNRLIARPEDSIASYHAPASQKVDGCEAFRLNDYGRQIVTYA